MSSSRAELGTLALGAGLDMLWRSLVSIRLAVLGEVWASPCPCADSAAVAAGSPDPALFLFSDYLAVPLVGVQHACVGNPACAQRT